MYNLRERLPHTRVFFSLNQKNSLNLLSAIHEIGFFFFLSCFGFQSLETLKSSIKQQSLGDGGSYVLGGEEQVLPLNF